MHDDAQVIAAWQRNAAPWTAAVRGRHIESRRLVTDAAMLEAIRRHRPRTVLDAGCGEGWLLRALRGEAEHRVGTDAVATLIEAARADDDAVFHVLSYEALAAGALSERFAVVACNFALIGDSSVAALFAALPALLDDGGVFILQTLHPLTACGDAPYADGWREGSWLGCGDAFADAPPWYFRTFASWVALFGAHGLRVREVHEPRHPHSGAPASLLVVGERAGR